MGAITMVVGFTQLILYFATNVAKGPFSIGGGSAARSIVVLAQILGCLAAIGTMVVGILAIVTLAEDTKDDAGLKWRDPDLKDNWVKGGQAAFAVGAYGLTLVVLGCMQLLASLKLTKVLRPIHSWSLLGIFGIIIGILCLAVAGNTVRTVSLCIVSMIIREFYWGH